jgi:putative transposase
MTTKFVYRFKLEPTPEQEHQLRRLAGARRFIWNWGLARRRAHYAEHGKTLRYPALNLELTALKGAEDTNWLRDLDSQALQESLRDLDRSFVNFFEKRARFPKFKKKRKQRDAFRIPQRVKIEGERVYCPKVGWIRLRLSQPVTVPTKSATFKRDACGDWYVTLVAEREVEAQIALPVNAVGVDLGLKTFATSRETYLILPSRNSSAKPNAHCGRCSAYSRVERKAAHGELKQRLEYLVSIARQRGNVTTSCTRQRLRSLHATTSSVSRTSVLRA